MDYFTDEIKNKIDKLIKDWNYSGTVCITHDGQNVFERAYGLADRENQISNSLDTTYYIASVTKQFTTASIMLLHERKLLDINHTLNKYLPEYTHADKMTLRQLMNMTTGVADYLNDVLADIMNEEEKNTLLSPRDFVFDCIEKWFNRQYSLTDILNLVNDLPLKFMSGEKMEYCNTNYYFLSTVIERVSGQRFGEFLKDNIFEPLGMTHTCVGSQNATAISYDMFEDELIMNGRGKLNAGDGAIVTTVGDLALWLNAVLDGKVLTKDSWDQTFNMYLGAYGFGWQTYDVWYYHGGSLLGYDANAFISFELDVSIAMLANIPTQMKGKEDEYSLVRNLYLMIKEMIIMKE